MKTHHDLTKCQASDPEVSGPRVSIPPSTIPSAVQSDVFVERHAATRAEAEQAFGAVFELGDPAEPEPRHG